MPDSDDRVVVIDDGRGGLLLAQTESDSWSLVQRPSEAAIIALAFADANTAWAIDYSGALFSPRSPWFTNDGGSQWVPLDPRFPADIPCIDIDFVDNTHGWVIGTDGSVYATIDGQDWFDPTEPHRTSFAPWYYVSTCLTTHEDRFSSRYWKQRRARIFQMLEANELFASPPRATLGNP